MKKSNKYGELLMLYFILMLGFVSLTIIDFGTIGSILKLLMILITILISVLTISNKADSCWKKVFIDGNIIKKIKDYHFKFCVAILTLFSIFVFMSGLTLTNTTQTVYWWFLILYGWSGLTVSLKLNKILN